MGEYAEDEIERGMDEWIDERISRGNNEDDEEGCQPLLAPKVKTLCPKRFRCYNMYAIKKCPNNVICPL